MQTQQIASFDPQFQLDKQFVCCQQKGNHVSESLSTVASNLYTGSHTRSTSSRGSWSWRLVERLVQSSGPAENLTTLCPRIFCARINGCLHCRSTLDMQYVWTCYLSQSSKYQKGKPQQSMYRLISALPNYDLRLGCNIVKPSPHHPLSDPISHANLQRKRKLQVADCVICSLRGCFEHLEKQQRKVHYMNIIWILNTWFKWLYEQRPKPLKTSRVQDVHERVLGFLCDSLFFLRCWWQHEASMSCCDCSSSSKVLVGAHIIVYMCICMYTYWYIITVRVYNVCGYMR